VLISNSLSSGIGGAWGHSSSVNFIKAGTLSQRHSGVTSCIARSDLSCNHLQHLSYQVSGVIVQAWNRSESLRLCEIRMSWTFLLCCWYIELLFLNQVKGGPHQFQYLSDQISCSWIVNVLIYRAQPRFTYHGRNANRRYTILYPGRLFLGITRLDRDLQSHSSADNATRLFDAHFVRRKPPVARMSTSCFDKSVSVLEASTSSI
jgi:hypothetical protein